MNIQSTAGLKADHPPISTARQSLARLDARIASLSNTQHKAWLSTYRDHWWNEVIGDVDKVMATVSHGPIRYTFDGHPFLTPEGGMDWVNSHEATRRMYEGVVALGVRMAGPTDDERILFDEDGLVYSCILTVVYPGVFLSSYADAIDRNGFYLLRWPNATMIRFDEHGLMKGEEILNGAPLLVRQVDASVGDALVDGPLSGI